VIGVIHNCSRVSHLTELYNRTGAQGIQFGEDLPMDEAKKKLGNSMCLIGNLTPIGILSTGSPTEVEAACRDPILKGGQGDGLILSSLGSVNRKTSMENLEAMFRAAEEYGRYPLQCE
jgi:uroporphyrinogen decarboxylase